MANTGLTLVVAFVSSLIFSTIFYAILHDTPEQFPINTSIHSTPVRYIKTPTPLSFVATPVKGKTPIIWSYVACDQDGILFVNSYCPHNNPPGGS